MQIFKKFFLFLNLFFNRRIIALQCWLVSTIHQHVSAIGIHMSPPSWPSLLLPSHPIPPLYVVTERWFEFPESYSKFPLALYFTYGNISFHVQFSTVQSLSCVLLFVTPWAAAHQASLSITDSWILLKLMSIESVMPSTHLILWHSLLLPPSIFPTIRVFSNESALCIRWPKYWSFSFSISPSNEHSGLIRMDWLDLLAVQGTLKNLLQHHSSKVLQHHSSKVSIFQRSAFL